MMISEILQKYLAGTLAEEDDTTLHGAVDTLTKARQTANSNQNEAYHSQQDSMIYAALQRIENFILNLLKTRYGCND